MWWPFFFWVGRNLFLFSCVFICYCIRVRSEAWYKHKKRKRWFYNVSFSHKQIAGVEPVSPAWEASVLPMNYICIINLLTEYLTGQNQSNTHQWSIWDSNPRPPQCECGALPTALIPHTKIISRKNRISSMYLDEKLYKEILFNLYNTTKKIVHINLYISNIELI